MFATIHMCYSLRFVLPKLKLAGSKKFSSDGERECHSPMINPFHVIKKFQMTKNGPQKEAFLIKTNSDSSRKQRTKKREMLFKS